jgi:hypothetical protein
VLCDAPRAIATGSIGVITVWSAFEALGVVGGKRSMSLLSIRLQAPAAHFGCQLPADQRVRGWIVEMSLLLQMTLRHLLLPPFPVGVC